MAEHGRKGDPRSISHGLPDDLETTIGERLAARKREGDRTHVSPRAPDQTDEIGHTDAPVAPGEGDA